jgi:2-amino-4-hydroxy-6-hydroxymethyldihydropteridine diphosphokinase
MAGGGGSPRRVGHLSLGANLGDRRAALQAAVDALGARGITVTASSSTYETDPVGLVLDQPVFLNACVAIATDLEPEALLDAVKDVERALGRETDPAAPGYVRHGPRPIDVDVLLLGDRAHRSQRLTVPHPALLERRFVLIPLLELDLELETPGGVRLADALAALPVSDGVRRAGPPLALSAPAA